MAWIRISALFLMMLFITGITACGKMGPLYLPDESEQQNNMQQPINTDT